MGFIGRWLGAVVFLAAAVPVCVPAMAADWTASHQFNRDDVRDGLTRVVASEMRAAGLQIRIFPDSSLMGALDQWAALRDGSLDMAMIPVDYLTRDFPELGVLSLPGVVVSHDQARRLSATPVMRELRSRLEAAGVVVIADAWVPGAFGSTKGCIRTPADAKGLTVRPSGWGFTELWRAAGASTVAGVSSDAVHRLLSSNLIDTVDTSTPSMLSYRLHERLTCLIAPGDVGLWFLYEPLLVSRKSFNALAKSEQTALMAAGRKAEDLFAGRILATEEAMVAAFRNAGTEVVTLSAEDAEPWIDLARRSVWKTFAEQVPGGEDLLQRVGAVR